MMSHFMLTIILNFFVAFGVITGGSFLGGIGALLAGQPPFFWMGEIFAEKLKIWAVVAAIGGTIDTLAAIERGFLSGSHGEILKHLLFIFSAFLGAHSGTKLIQWFVGGQIH
jgi:hypothetical protein